MVGQISISKKGKLEWMLLPVSLSPSSSSCFPYEQPNVLPDWTQEEVLPANSGTGSSSNCWSVSTDTTKQHPQICVSTEQDGWADKQCIFSCLCLLDSSTRKTTIQKEVAASHPSSIHLKKKHLLLAVSESSKCTWSTNLLLSLGCWKKFLRWKRTLT